MMRSPLTTTPRAVSSSREAEAGLRAAKKGLACSSRDERAPTLCEPLRRADGCEALKLLGLLAAQDQKASESPRASLDSLRSHEQRAAGQRAALRAFERAGEHPAAAVFGPEQGRAVRYDAKLQLSQPGQRGFAERLK